MDRKQELMQKAKTSLYAHNLIERASMHMTRDDRLVAIEVLKGDLDKPQVLREIKPRKKADQPAEG